MKTYLDTNVTVWLAQGAMSRISQTALQHMETVDLLVSPMVLLELEYLYEIGRILLPARDLELKLRHEIGVQVCELDFASVSNVALSENWTRDPFDRIIVAHAKANGLAYLVSADEEIQNRYPRTVW